MPSTIGNQVKLLIASPELAGVWGITAAALSNIFGVVDPNLVFIIVFFVLIDTVTGIIASKSEKNVVTSRKAFKSISKVLAYISFVGTSSLLAGACNNEFIGKICPDSLLNGMFSALVCMWIIYIEIKSIFENLSRLGYGVPPMFKVVLDKLRDSLKESQTK